MTGITRKYPSQQSVTKPFQLSNFTVRLLTALVFLPLGLFGAWAGGILWLLMITPLALIGTVECFMMASGRYSQGSALIAVPAVIVLLVAFYVDMPLFTPFILLAVIILTAALETLRHPSDLRQTRKQILSTLGGVCYVGLPSAFLIAIRAQPDGFLWLMVILAATWGTDTFAYFGGRAFGKHKLAPRLSPNKTIEGAIFGVIGGILPALLFLAAGENLSVYTALMVAGAPFVAITGDLFESALKRRYGVKDSHVAGLNIIPGHGGVLDRVDALLLVTIYFYVCMILIGII